MKTSNTTRKKNKLEKEAEELWKQPNKIKGYAKWNL